MSAIKPRKAGLRFPERFRRKDAAAEPGSVMTPRLLLRPLRMADAKDFHAYAKNPRVARYVLWDAHESLGQTRGVLRGQIKDSIEEGLLTLAITLRASGRMVGTIGLVWRERNNHAAEVGFSLAEDCWGQGLMTEALTAYLQHIFLTTDIRRVEALHDALNPSSGSVMRKADMKAEGLMREKIYYKGAYASVVLYAALKDEWLAGTGSAPADGFL